jgi:hypothetical protein
MTTAWQPFYLGRKVSGLPELEGMLIPDPDALQGWVVYVVNVPAPVNGPSYYSLNLNSGAPIDAVNVRPTLLGGNSRWIRIMFGGSPLGGPPTSIQPDDLPDEGISMSGARSDHTHGIVAAVAGSIQPDDVPDEGVADSFSRSDHQHGIVAAVAGVIQPDDVPDEGIAESFSRSDHQHGIAADVPVPVGLVLDEGVSTAFARADHVHTLGGPALNKFSGAILVWGNLDIGTSTTPRYLTSGYDSVAAPTVPIQYRIPVSGTLDLARVRVRSPGTPSMGPPGMISYQVRINNALTLLVVTMVVTAFDGSDLIDSVAVVAGDLVDIEVIKPGAIMTSPTSPMFSMRFRPN